MTQFILAIGCTGIKEGIAERWVEVELGFGYVWFKISLRTFIDSCMLLCTWDTFPVCLAAFPTSTASLLVLR